MKIGVSVSLDPVRRPAFRPAGSLLLACPTSAPPDIDPVRPRHHRQVAETACAHGLPAQAGWMIASDKVHLLHMLARAGDSGYEAIENLPASSAR